MYRVRVWRAGIRRGASLLWSVGGERDQSVLAWLRGDAYNVEFLREAQSDRAERSRACGAGRDTFLYLYVIILDGAGPGGAEQTRGAGDASTTSVE